tara:strand:+ start:168 stop:851 length:684 start_codon:yes stop_codon:yes gene_type:complete
MFHVQLGDRKRTQDALRVASSFFANGLEKFAAGELHEALALFEQALAVNQKYLESTASGNILCYNHIAAVHDRLGNLGTAFAYYERARVGLSSPRIPDNEANFFARRKRNVMLKHVQQKLEKIPRTHEPKVGAGVHHSDVASLIVSMWEAGEVHLHAGRLNEARVSFEQARDTQSNRPAPAPSVAPHCSHPSSGPRPQQAIQRGRGRWAAGHSLHAGKAWSRPLSAG